MKKLLTLLMSIVFVMSLAACAPGTAQSSGTTPDMSTPATTATTDAAKVLPEATQADRDGVKPVEIWLVRHGTTLFNEKSLVQGWSDAPLTEDGEALTGYVGMGLKAEGIAFNALYSSDLTRCLRTSEILLEKMESALSIQSDKRFREMNFGDFEGEPISIMLELYPNIYNFNEFPGTPSGESWDDLLDRVLPGLNEIGENHKSEGGKVMVVTHGMVVLDVIHYLDPDFQATTGAMPNNSITIIEYNDGTLSLKSMPDTSYSEKGMAIAGVKPPENSH